MTTDTNKISNKNKNFSPLLIFLAGMLWGSMGLFVRRLSVYGFTTPDILLIRVSLPLVLLLVYMLIFSRDSLKVKIRDLWCFVGTGILSLLFFNYCYFRAMSITDLSVAAVLLYTAPAFVMVMSFFLFKESFTGRKVIALVLTFIGCVFVTGLVGGVQEVSAKGILFGLGAGFGYALYSIFGRYAIMRGYGSLTITFYTFLFSFIGSCFIASPVEVCAGVSANPGVILWAVGIGIFCTILPYILYTAGLANVENGKASIIASIEPITATVLGALIFGETLDVFGVIGIALVLGGILLCNTGSKSRG